jgi:predicted nucleic acid-binding protein
LIEAFYAKYVVVEVSKAVLLKASALREQYSLSFWDSTIVSSALSAEAAILYSEDMQDELMVENRMRIINPLKKPQPTDASSRGRSA